MELRKLQLQARQSAENRGHTLGRWMTNHNDEHDTALATCIHCGHFVQCDTRPLPNGIDIGGTAVARDCKAQALRFAEEIRIALNPWPADSRADTVLRNITRTIEGA